jgi:2-polyprenyl-6-methoxyphenol hydroxylase-like FAD-dependent oxidoreductase
MTGFPSGILRPLGFRNESAAGELPRGPVEAGPQLASGATIAIEDSMVLAELVQSGVPVQEALEKFMARRYERCRLVVENSRQLGEWEKSPATAGSDPTALDSASMKALAEPI